MALLADVVKVSEGIAPNDLVHVSTIRVHEYSGGPEEGGWSYTCRECYSSILVPYVYAKGLVEYLKFAQAHLTGERSRHSYHAPADLQFSITETKPPAYDPPTAPKYS